MNRRGFLGSIIAACAAPAIVRADSLMRIVARDATVIAPEIGRIETFQFYESSLSDHAADALAYAFITQEALRIAHENAVFVRAVNHRFDSGFVGKFASTVRVRVPR